MSRTPGWTQDAVDAIRAGQGQTQTQSPAVVRVPKGPNKTELNYYRSVLLSRNPATIVRIVYGALAFYLANGHRYRPDWIVFRVDGRIECHEVKGPYRLGSYQRARLAFDQARVEFPEFVWVWREKGASE